MRITSLQLTKNPTENGLRMHSRMGGQLASLERIVFLTGGNGSGKTRLLRLIESEIHHTKTGTKNPECIFRIFKKGKEKTLTQTDAQSLHVINYSHFDAKLQTPNNFSPYIIHRAKEKLKQCNYEETALNSLLYLHDLAALSDDNQEKFLEFVTTLHDFGIKLSWDEEKNELNFFGQSLKTAALSPGQIYILRVVIGCYVHQKTNVDIILLDEPETHLHPNMQIKLLNLFLEKFPQAQLWIATHSLELLSYFITNREDATVVFLESGEIRDILRSNSEPILRSLLGSNETQSAVQQLFQDPIQYACNQFSIQCLKNAEVKEKGRPGDPQVTLIEEELTAPCCVLDYGAGKGRLYECLMLDDWGKRLRYFAYDINPENKKTWQKLKEAYAPQEESNYYTTERSLFKNMTGKADCVLLVNVLHEIPPQSWAAVFKNIHRLLKETGTLYIVEREYLMNGESNFPEGFLMLTDTKDTYPQKAADCLFDHHYRLKTSGEKTKILCFSVERAGVEYAATQTGHIKATVEILRQTALDAVKALKSSVTEGNPFIEGIKLSFWVHQFTNATLALETL